MPNKARILTVIRDVDIDADTWTRAQARAQAEGLSIRQFIRRAVVYVLEHVPTLTKGPSHDDQR